VTLFLLTLLPKVAMAKMALMESMAPMARTVKMASMVRMVLTAGMVIRLMSDLTEIGG